MPNENGQWFSNQMGYFIKLKKKNDIFNQNGK